MQYEGRPTYLLTSFAGGKPQKSLKLRNLQTLKEKAALHLQKNRAETPPAKMPPRKSRTTKVCLTVSKFPGLFTNDGSK